jgi:hypothetical protein
MENAPLSNSKEQERPAFHTIGMTTNYVAPGAKQKIVLRKKKKKEKQVQRQGEKWKGAWTTA